jgi:hypothetical protein
MSIRITCINKAGGQHENPHVAIPKLGWTEDGTGKSGIWTREQMYDWLKDGGMAYVKDARGDVAWLITEISSRGTKFVRTQPDWTKADNLLSLGECR